MGESLGKVLFSPAAEAQVRQRMQRTDLGRARLTIRVSPWTGAGAGSGAEGDQALRLADRALALPWELLRVGGEFPLRAQRLDLVREAVAEGTPGLPEPAEALTVAVSIAAPEDQTTLRHEEEAYRLMQALQPSGHAYAFADLGGMGDLVRLVESAGAQAIHFSGHGLPGKLVFENELGFAEPVAVEDLVRELNGVLLEPGSGQGFPRLFYLASCRGSSTGPVAGGTPPAEGDRGAEDAANKEGRELSALLEESRSTAATLHRVGFAQVAGYFGPVDDALSTRAEEAFYQALARGESTLQAAAEARLTLDRPLPEGAAPGEQQYRYPLGWSQLALYHRGPDRPLTKKREHKTSAWRSIPKLGGWPGETAIPGSRSSPSWTGSRSRAGTCAPRCSASGPASGTPRP